MITVHRSLVKNLFRLPALAAGCWLAASSSFAVVTTFDLAWSGAGSIAPNSAVATGTLTVDTAVLANNTFKYADIQSFSITVFGAAAGNGTFVKSDFNEASFDNGGVAFDFAQNLVGQGGWGYNSFSPVGFFNLSAAIAVAPTGVYPFILGTNSVIDVSGEASSSGNHIVLTSFAASAIPEPTTYTAIFGVLALGSSCYGS
jgi:hypothetical protein